MASEHLLAQRVSALQTRNLKSIIWNIDWEEWADPILESSSARVIIPGIAANAKAASQARQKLRALAVQ